MLLASWFGVFGVPALTIMSGTTAFHTLAVNDAQLFVLLHELLARMAEFRVATWEVVMQADNQTRPGAAEGP